MLSCNIQLTYRAINTGRPLACLPPQTRPLQACALRRAGQLSSWNIRASSSDTSGSGASTATPEPGPHEPAGLVHAQDKDVAGQDVHAQDKEAPGQDGSTWGENSPPGDWSAAKPFSFKAADWGLIGLIGVILGLSFGAYRVLDHFRVYQHSQRRLLTPVVTTQVVDRSSKPKGKPPSKPQDPSSDKHTSKQAADKPSAKSEPKCDSTSSKSQPAEPAATAAAAATATATAAQAGADEAVGPSQSGDVEGGLAPAHAGSASPRAMLGVPGAPQPSPLDQDYQSTTTTPWAGSDLGHLSLPPLELQPDQNEHLPALPSIQVEQPSKSVAMAELESLPQDSSIPTLRERAHIAMRSSAAAMESSQRAAAYSAAASSASSRAAEAAEQAAGAAARIQTALESASETAMAAAMERMNRAVEMVAEAESKAATAAAMATAYQDISEHQAEIATKAADVPLPLPQQGPGAVRGRVADIHALLHAKLFSIGNLLQEWVAGAAAGVLALLGQCKAGILAAWAVLVGFAKAAWATVAKPF